MQCLTFKNTVIVQWTTDKIYSEERLLIVEQALARILGSNMFGHYLIMQLKLILFIVHCIIDMARVLITELLMMLQGCPMIVVHLLMTSTNKYYL